MGRRAQSIVGERGGDLSRRYAEEVSDDDRNNNRDRRARDQVEVERRSALEYDQARDGGVTIEMRGNDIEHGKIGAQNHNHRRDADDDADGNWTCYAEDGHQDESDGSPNDAPYVAGDGFLKRDERAASAEEAGPSDEGGLNLESAI